MFNIGRGRDRTVKSKSSQNPRASNYQSNNQYDNSNVSKQSFFPPKSYSKSPKKFSISRSQSRERSQTKSRDNSPFHRTKSAVLPAENHYRSKSGNRFPSPTTGKMNYVDFRNSNYNKCAICRGGHKTESCYQYFRPSKYPCDSCLKQTKEILYHKAIQCPYNKNTKFGDRSLYKPPTARSRERNVNNNQRLAKKGYFDYKPLSAGSNSKNA